MYFLCTSRLREAINFNYLTEEYAGRIPERVLRRRGNLYENFFLFDRCFFFSSILIALG